MVTRTQLLPFLAGAGVVALFATSMVAVSQAQRAGEEAERADRLEARVVTLEDEVATLEDEVERLEASGGLDGLLGGLLGGGDLGDLSGLLDGLLGGDAGGLDDLLGGLLGPGGGDGEDAFGDLFGDLFGAGGIPGADCLTPAGGGLDGLLEGGLGSLFGGGGSDTDGDLDDVVATVTTQMEELRELSFDREVEVAFLDDDAIGAELAELLDEGLDPAELAARTAVLQALRAVPADVDLDGLQRDLLDDQVAGYYVPEDGRLVVRSPDDGQLSALDRIVLAHELEHALADQAIGLPDLDDGLDTDAALARLSVVEGDATLAMNLWTLEHVSLLDQVSMLGAEDLAGQTEVLDQVPHHLQRELLFPYTAGLDLICDRWLEGGWAAVDDAYGQLPPTTAAVLFGDRGQDGPAAVPAPSAPAGAGTATTDTFGAAELLWLLEAPGDDTDAALDQPLERAAAWAGGEVTVWDTASSTDGPVVALVLRDRDAGDPALCDTVTGWLEAAYGGEVSDTTVTDDTGTAALRCDGDLVRLGFASDADVARGVVG